MIFLSIPHEENIDPLSLHLSNYKKNPYKTL